MRLTAALAVVVGASLLVPTAAQAAPPTPFGHTCEPQNGVLFCPTKTLADRVPSFDGTPLDVDVTLPADARKNRPLPTIVMMHGWGGSKKNFETTSPEGTSSTTWRWNNVYYAQRGYAVLNYTARGFGRSCGREESSNSTPACLVNRSYVHLADRRWESRDTQHLLGLLADERVTRPGAIGATGISYGGGQSIELAYLRNRIQLPDGSFARWMSPGGKRLSLAAAYPRWPWSDLVASLEPNGRFLDSVASPTESRNPLGVLLQSYNAGLFALGETSGTYCGAPPRPPCDDFSADINRWFARAEQGEPEDQEARAIADEIFNFHQGFGVNEATPSPMLIENGWTDDLFPPREGIRVYNDVGSRTPVSLQFGDLGHSRGSNKTNVDHYFNEQGSAFFDRYLRGNASALAPSPGSVTAFTQTCPKAADGKGPFTASSYDTLAQGQVEFSKADTQTVSSGGGNPLTASGFDPIANSDACKQTDAETAPGTAVVEGETVPDGAGYTLLGLPTVTATIATTGNNGQLDSRLWDVGGGKQTLVSRTAYRLEDGQNGTITFQLNGNGWCFAPGHRPKLELLGKDEPFLRPSNTPFSVNVSNVNVKLPTAEATQAGCAG